MKVILSGQIDRLNFENEKPVRGARIIRATLSTVAKLYSYGASRSTKPPMLRVHISNLKVRTADPNR
jgi:hypothetical protein